METTDSHLSRPLLQVVSHSFNGGTRSSFFILASVCMWHLSYFGIYCNLVLFFTRVLCYNSATAASTTTSWLGSTALCSTIGAFIADSFLGKFWTSILFQLLNLVAMALLSLSTSQIVSSGQISPFLIRFFYVSLYLVAIANGAFQPTIQSLGADQFDAHEAKSSYFSRHLVSANIGMACAFTGIVYAVSKQGWAFGFWLCTAGGAVAVTVFLIGSHSDAYHIPSGYPAWSKCKTIKFQELKCNFRIIPIWVSSIFFYAVYAQPGTLFVEQGATMNTQIGDFSIEPANMNLFSIVTITFSPIIYTKLIDPCFRRLTDDPTRSLSPLQRMGIGYAISCIAILSAALVETRRLKFAREGTTISIFWLIPPYCLLGVAQFFVSFGQSEFFYGEAPQSMRSLGCSLCFTSISLGSYLSSLLLTVVNRITTWGDMNGAWIPEDLSNGHLNYFYAFLAGLAAFNLLFFVKNAIRFQSCSSYVKEDCSEA